MASPSDRSTGVDAWPVLRYRRGIASDISNPRSPSDLLLKAVRALPEDEQGAVLAYLLDRALVPEPTRQVLAPSGTEVYPRRVAPPFTMRTSLWTAAPWPRWGASLILGRLAGGAGIDELASELGLGVEVLGAALRDLAKRPQISEPGPALFQRLAEGGTVAGAAAQLGLSPDQVAAALEPTEGLLDSLCSAVMARAAIPSPPSEYLGGSPSGPLRTMPVRFPEPLYQRLKDWSEQHNFPMAVIVRGLVERFLDEQERRGA